MDKAKAILSVVNHYLLHGDYPHLDKSEFNVIAQALQRFVAPEGEAPVAWRFKPSKAAKRWAYTDHPPTFVAEGEIVEPLYLSTPQVNEE